MERPLTAQKKICSGIQLLHLSFILCDKKGKKQQQQPKKTPPLLRQYNWKEGGQNKEADNDDRGY